MTSHVLLLDLQKVVTRYLVKEIEQKFSVLVSAQRQRRRHHRHHHGDDTAICNVATISRRYKWSLFITRHLSASIQRFL